MRLKEPLYGLRVAQLHFVIHLTMALVMIWIESEFIEGDYTNDFQYHGKLRQTCYHDSFTDHSNDGAAVDSHAINLMNIKSQYHKLNPYGFYKRAYYHLTQNEPILTNLSGGPPLPEFAGKVTNGHYPQQDMTIFMLLHAAHIICALFQLKRTFNSNIGTLMWKKVRSIPKDCEGWNPQVENLTGKESFGNPREQEKAWGIKFSDLNYSAVKVETNDGKVYRKIYNDKSSIIDVSANQIPFLQLRDKDDKEKILRGKGVGVYILHRESDEGVLLGLFTQMIGVSFYLLMILYTIWKRKLIDLSGFEDKKHASLCDSLVTGWLRFEIRVFMFWIISCVIFLVFFNLFKCRSKIKKYDETLNLESIWRTKNSMDYLHYMQFEQENFNLIMGPFLADCGTWVLNERGEHGWMDYFMTSSCIVIRFLLLVGFLWNLNKNVQGQQLFWKVYYALIFCAYCTVIGMYFGLSDETGKHHHNVHQNVRISNNHFEMVAIPLLIIYHEFLSKLMRERMSRKKEQSVQIIFQRRSKFQTLLLQCENQFLEEHGIPKENRANKIVKSAEEQLILHKSQSQEQVPQAMTKSAKSIYNKKVIEKVLSGSDVFDKETPLHEYFAGKQYIKSTEALLNQYEKGEVGDQIIATQLLEILKNLELSNGLIEKGKHHKVNINYLIESGVAKFFNLQYSHADTLKKKNKRRLSMHIKQYFTNVNHSDSEDEYQNAEKQDSEDTDAASDTQEVYRNEDTSQSQEKHFANQKPNKITFHANQFYATELTLIVFSKKAGSECGITPQKMSEYAIYYFLVVFVQISMTYAMGAAIVYGHQDYHIYAGAWATIFFAKFVSACALHLVIYPDIARTMMLMKYILNHEHKFHYPKFCFLITLTALIVLIDIECLNMFQLLFWSTVEFTVIYLMAFKIITWIPRLYYDALMDDYLKEKLASKYAYLDIEVRGADVKFSERDVLNKVGRVIYKLMRAIYVSVVFYFQPFILVFLYFFLIKQGDLDPTPVDT